MSVTNFKNNEHRKEGAAMRAYGEHEWGTNISVSIILIKYCPYRDTLAKYTVP
jgi:hypothetical protein